MARSRLSFLVVVALVASACQSAAPSASQGGAATEPPASQGAETAAPATPAGGPVTGGTLRVVRAFDVNNWDIAISNSEGSINHSLALYATLLRASEDGTELEPYLADTWTHNDAWTEFTFNLNPDAKFCDGSPITSADVIWSWERAIPSPSVSWMFPPDITMTAPDAQTVSVVLEAGNVAFPWWTTLWGMMVLSKAYGEGAPAELMATSPLGSGPFCLDSWERGSQINLVRNENFWMTDAEGNRLPYVDRVEMEIVPDANSRILKLQAGEADVNENVPGSQLAAIENLDGVVTETSDLLGTGAVVLNKRTPFIDPKIRQAANYAVDKDAIIKIALNGVGRPSKSFLSGGLYSTDEFGYDYDLEQAKQLMAESTMPDGFAAEYMIRSGDTVGEQIGVVLKEQLAAIGIELTLVPLEGGAFSERWQAGDFDMLYKLGTLDIYDSSENLNFDVNLAGYGGIRDESLWQLAQEASAQPDEAKRAEQFLELQRRWMEAPPYILLIAPLNVWATAEGVQGYKFLNSGAAPLDKVWLEPGG